MYRVVLFDLDGTITDPGIGITNSVAYALDKYSIKVSDLSELYRFIGPPLQDSFRDFYGFSEAESKRAVSYYREYYGTKGIFENKVYDGIVEMLFALKTAGKTVMLATSKPELYALQILQHYDLMTYFDRICGANMDGTRAKKSEVISYALQFISDVRKNDIVMIGDRKHDIEGANMIGIDSIGVTYGYGTQEELEAAGATHIANSPNSILRFFS